MWTFIRKSVLYEQHPPYSLLGEAIIAHLIQSRDLHTFLARMYLNFWGAQIVKVGEQLS